MNWNWNSFSLGGKAKPTSQNLQFLCYGCKTSSCNLSQLLQTIIHCCDRRSIHWLESPNTVTITVSTHVPALDSIKDLSSHIAALGLSKLLQFIPKADNLPWGLIMSCEIAFNASKLAVLQAMYILHRF